MSYRINIRPRRGAQANIAPIMSNVPPQNNPNVNVNTNRPITGFNSLWNNHVQKIMIKNNISWNDAMKEASKTFPKIKKDYAIKNDIMIFYRQYIEVVKK